ncbi:MAG: hypothetical protein AB1791_19165, partial [Chloroflexota bacterium]
MQDRFAELITIDTLGVGAVILALVAAFGWGALHALTPGHGKTIVAAYLVGSRGTPRHALFLGLTTTITHTTGVFALGLLVLLASEYVLPERLYPWLAALSGILVVAIGFSLLRGRWRQWRGTNPLPRPLSLAGRGEDGPHPRPLSLAGRGEDGPHPR